MAELVAASMSNLQGPMLHTAASEEFSVGFFKILPSATRNAQKMQSFVKTVASSDVLGSPTLQGSLGLEHTQRDKSKSGERLLEESISGEKYPQLQVMNCKKLKVPDSRYKVLEVHEIYSKVTKSISQPIIKHGSAVQAKNKYPSFNFDTMREALASNNFPQAKAEILELDSMYKLSQDQWTSLKTSCTPCTKRCLLGEFTPSSKHRSTQERVAAIELGTWYNEQLLKLHKNQADNSFANSNTLYSFVFRELLKLQTTECSQMAQLLLMLYMHSVSLIETGWKCSNSLQKLYEDLAVFQSAGSMLQNSQLTLMTGKLSSPFVDLSASPDVKLRAATPTLGSKSTLTPSIGLTSYIRPLPLIKQSREKMQCGDSAETKKPLFRSSPVLNGHSALRQNSPQPQQFKGRITANVPHRPQVIAS